MPNGNNLDIGDYVNWGYGQLSVHDGAAIIPMPDNSGRYYLFHTDLNFTDYDTFVNMLMSTNLFYSVIDMSLDGGLGDVVSGQKDILFFSDTLIQTGFKLVKHGNGRDYWLICHEAESNRFYRFLIDPYGIHGPYEQSIGSNFDGINALNKSTLTFSKDGSKASQLSGTDMKIDLYDFNRCSGELHNLQTIIVSDTIYYMQDSEFSPSGRFLYVSANYWDYIFQYDLTAPSIVASRQLIAVYDGSLNPFETDFDNLELGPDGKIYVNTYGYNYSIHTINQPDSAGTDCNFVENAITINPPGWDWNGVPNTINYSLGALVGSDCDTLSIDTTQYPKPTFTFGVYPNPFANELQLTITGAESEASFEIYNVLGQQVYQVVLSPQDYTIHQVVDASKFATGVYFIRLGVNGTQYVSKTVKN